MNKKEKKFNYTYQVYLTNPNSSLYGCLYFGKRSTDDLCDGYIGSGKLLKKYLKKYPNDYYRKILNFYNSQEELNKAEYELIHPHLNKSYCINLREGGEGGAMCYSICKEHSKKLVGRVQSEEEKAKRAKSLQGHITSDETRKKISIANKGNSACGRPGHKKTDEAREKIRQSKLGQKNPMYGKTPWNKGKKIENTWNKGKHIVWDDKKLNKFHYE